MKEMEFDYARMQLAAQGGFMNAWAAATYLVDRGVPSRLAHEAVGKPSSCALSREGNCRTAIAELQQMHRLRQ